MSQKDARGLLFDAKWMVVVKDAWKSYGSSVHILKGLNMNLEKGQIYSLLGSSGVGKTSLLECITGNRQLDFGEIHVNINSRLQISYMPQELALYAELTLKETFQFFSLILFMTPRESQERVEHLTKLLQLPSEETQISTLSGGQQRRVSVAVTLLNNPQFLILDEPTVGLDSILKDNIWNYLMRITKEENKTILLTTHYIEEASNSDKVGFMTDGQILLEGTTEEVKNHIQPPCEKLEDVYLLLCSKHQNTMQERQKEVQGKPKNKTAAVKSLSNLSNFSVMRIMAFILKTLFYIRRNLLIFYVFIFTPALMACLLTSALGKPKGITVGYVNLEDTCTNSYRNCSYLLSCRFLEKLGKSPYKLIGYNSIEQGKYAVERNYIWGLVQFNSNFSDGVIERMDYFFYLDKDNITDENEAKIWLDMSSFPISYMLKKHFYDSFYDSIHEWFDDCGWTAQTVHPVVQFKTPVYGVFEESLVSTGVPACTVILLLSVSVLLGMMFVITERELGTLRRCQVNGLKVYEMLISIFITCFCCLIPTGVALLLILYLYSGSSGPIFWAVVVLFLQNIIGILLGLLIGLHTSRLSDALQMTTGFLYTLTFLSGILWPSEGLHWVTKIAYKYLPTILPVDIFKTLSNRGYHDIVYVALNHSFIWIAIILILILISLKMMD